MSSKYIVRQQIKDANGAIVGYEILYHGDNQAFSTETDVNDDLAAANTVYNFLTQNTPKVFKGTLTFMTFTTMLLMKKTPRLFDKSELVIQIDDSVIIHPLSMHFVQQYAKEGFDKSGCRIYGIFVTLSEQLADKLSRVTVADTVNSEISLNALIERISQ